MPQAVERLPERLHAALLGAAHGEDAAGGVGGVRQLLATAEALVAGSGRVDDIVLRAHGLDAPPVAAAAALLPCVLPGLLTPLDRPRLRQAAHRLVTVTAADEGTAMTGVAVAVLAADLTRFDVDTALIRLRQTLLEEAPTALHLRLRPLQRHETLLAGSDPGACLQLAITALIEGDSVSTAVDWVATLDGEPAVAAALAGALAGARDGVCDAATVPARERIAGLAAALAAVAETAPPQRPALTPTSVLARLEAPAEHPSPQ